jgi:hypothetical protein
MLQLESCTNPAFTTVSTYFGQFSRDGPTEVFDTIRKKVLEQTSFGRVTVKSTAQQVTMKIVDKRKSVFLFNQMNAGGVVIEKRKLLIIKMEFLNTKPSRGFGLQD